MARCVVCGGGKGSWGTPARALSYCDDCFERLRQENLRIQAATPPGVEPAYIRPKRQVRSRTGLMLYYAVFGLLTIGLLIFAIFQNTVAFRFLFMDRASAIAQLTQETRDEEYVIQSRAVKDLVKLGGDDAIKVLMEVAQTTEHTIQQDAIAALGELGGDRAIQALIGLLQSDGVNAPLYASFALAKIGSPAVARLIAILDGNAKGNVSNAAMTLGMIDDPAAQARLQTAFDHQELIIIVGAIDYYIGVGKAGTEKILISALNKSDDVGMASSLLNCGNSTLEKAARTWASENGYKVTTFPFIGRDSYQQWGGGY